MADRTIIDRLIADAIVSGEAARAAIIDRAAQMPMEKLAVLPSSSIDLLGPGGIVKVIARKATIESRDAGSPPPTTTTTTTLERRSYPIRVALVAAIFVLAVGLAAERFVPMFSSVLDQGPRTIATANWPTCPRLDTYVDGCLYRVGGNGGLTLEGAARMLAIPSDQFAASNTHLNASITTILPNGSTIVVWRGKLKLKD